MSKVLTRKETLTRSRLHIKATYRRKMHYLEDEGLSYLLGGVFFVLSVVGLPIGAALLAAVFVTIATFILLKRKEEKS